MAVDSSAGGGTGAGFKPPDVFTTFVTMFEEAFGLAVDREQRVDLSIREALEGGRIDVALERLVACASCAGSGAAPGSELDSCSACYGEGTIDRTHRYFTATIPCPKCFGRKRCPRSPCATCRGAGRASKAEKLVVKIPPGVDDGYKLRLGGKGNFAMDGSKTGDTFLVLRVDLGPFSRRGTDLVIDVPITQEVANRGGRAMVPILEGQREIAVRPGTDEGYEHRMPGTGPLKPGASASDPNGRGDIIARFVIREVVTPPVPPATPSSRGASTVHVTPPPQSTATPPVADAPPAKSSMVSRVVMAIGVLAFAAVFAKAVLHVVKVHVRGQKPVPSASASAPLPEKAPRGLAPKPTTVSSGQ